MGRAVYGAVYPTKRVTVLPLRRHPPVGRLDDLYAAGIDGTRVVLPAPASTVHRTPARGRVRDVVRRQLRHHLPHRLRSLAAVQRDPASVADSVPATGTGGRPDLGGAVRGGCVDQAVDGGRAERPIGS